MQRFKAALLLKRSLHSRRFLNHYRTLCSVPDSALSVNDDIDNQVLVEAKAWSRTAILNRPSVLNALSTAMGARLQNLYTCWENDPDIGFVAMKGSGRGFCAGGDIVTLYHLIHAGKMEDCKEFFRKIYTFIYFLGTYLKPHVALLNGITMGGGAGVSIPGTFRVATDKTVFATPETLIGFHPDAGASFYLSHLPGHLGEYLGLTGEKLNGAEMIACGLASHYAHTARLPLIEEQLGKLVTDDPSVIETCLEKYSDLVYPDKTSVVNRFETLDKCFGRDTVEEIIDALVWQTGLKNFGGNFCGVELVTSLSFIIQLVEDLLSDIFWWFEDKKSDLAYSNSPGEMVMALSYGERYSVPMEVCVAVSGSPEGSFLHLVCSSRQNFDLGQS
ncbi:3-hydroxyisobutyryl-CoA hydrolase-like protein 1, mitochondrial isoform X2 [Alnus glutinosa]|uniref:3-hydroxyisobutyryl-CoA hydrolase-like protein 1, mitochondrial isoform X2 n=1 Tax=Alnus glutinosa TaxID=3517 RepID=UPI002D76D3E5|nr:3-hydroxyisobutyryl-CoA hydrolase-like protein 1, mitochondrial isoform X2 [Alnus glutinosa]